MCCGCWPLNRLGSGGVHSRHPPAQLVEPAETEPHAAPVNPEMRPKEALALRSRPEAISAAAIMMAAHRSALVFVFIEFVEVIGKAPFHLWKGHLSYDSANVKQTFQNGKEPLLLRGRFLTKG